MPGDRYSRSAEQGRCAIGHPVGVDVLRRTVGDVALIAVTLIDETQTVDAVFRRAGDITGDEAINLNDFAMFAVCFGQRWGNNIESACSNEALASSDLDRNGVIDLRDFATFALHFGR